MNDDLVARIEALSDDQVTEVLRQLLLEVDQAPAVTEEERAQRSAEDVALVREVASAAGAQPAATPDARGILVAIATQVEGLEPALDRALEAATRPDTTLDFGASLAIGTLVVAVAGAILRPRVAVHEKETKGADGSSTKERTRELEVRGVKDVAGLVKAILPFV